MKPRALAPFIAVALSTAGCKPTTIVAGQPGDHDVNRPEVKLPPPVKESHTYRCMDNTIVYVDYLADDRTANLRTSDQGPIIKLVGSGASFAGSGYGIERGGVAITLRRSGHPSQRCIQ